MAAGVHGAVLAGKGQTGLLGDGQGVDIAPEQDGLARLAQGDDYSGLAAYFALDSHGLQLAHNAVHGVAQVESHAGVGVDIPAVFCDFRSDLLGSFQIRVHLLASSFVLAD